MRALLLGGVAAVCVGICSVWLSPPSGAQPAPPAESAAPSSAARAFAAPVAPAAPAPPAAKPEPTIQHGLRVAPGFRVTLFSDHELANDIYAMTLDPRGRVVVSGAGYFRRLEDTNGDGRADRAVPLGTTQSGSMGMAFDVNGDLLSSDDSQLRRRRADPANPEGPLLPPEKLFAVVHNEHGSHNPRRGPDGWWYLIGGNDSRVDVGLNTLPRPIRTSSEGGGVLRFSPDGLRRELIATGFRNPYRFDFNADGEMFTYDSDCERDFLLPWYTPTRVSHVGLGLHHGWRLPGYLRAYARPPDSPDTTEWLWPIGRGSPTGLVCYRHRQFPLRFRGGLFAADWTFGRVWFLPLLPNGAGYRTQAEVLLEPVGSDGFAPCDLAVAPDGALLVAIGGRRTRGAVYRVEWVGTPDSPLAPAQPRPTDELTRVLSADQPLEAWSRAVWDPLARQLGDAPFRAAAADAARPPEQRVRAVEILTELFGGLRGEALTLAASADTPASVRARVAWSLGRRPPMTGAAEALRLLVRDADPRVLRAAWEAVLTLGEPTPLPREIVLAAGHADHRVRLIAAEVAARRPAEERATVRATLAESARPDIRAEQTLLLAELLAEPTVLPNGPVIERLTQLLDASTDPQLRLATVRLLIRAMGDYHLHKPPAELWTAYSVSHPVAESARLRASLNRIFPSGDARLDEEATRLLAVLADDDATLPGRLLAQVSAGSSATDDLHRLIVLSRLRGAWPSGLATRVADALLSLDGKLGGKQLRTKQLFTERHADVSAALLSAHAELEEPLLAHRRFTDAAHVGLGLALPKSRRTQAAESFLRAAESDADYVWSAELLELLSALPDGKLRPALRGQWSNFGLRDRIVTLLARGKPDVTDRARFRAGLESAVPSVAATALTALEKLPTPTEAAEREATLTALFGLLRRACNDPPAAALRKQTVAAIAGLAERQWPDLTEPADKPDANALRAVYQPLWDWLAASHPRLSATALADGGTDPAEWERTMQSVPWEAGNAARGAEVFRQRACQTCHAGTRPLGPDLSGAADRMSRADLFTAIVYPNRDVAPAYRTTSILLRDGQVVTGLIAFESADGLIVQTGATTTVRLADADIEARRPSSVSLMPGGLLKDLPPQGIADLHAYLRTLKK